MSSIDLFMQNCLVKWIEHFNDDVLLTFEDFADGHLLWDFFKIINTRCDLNEIQRQIDEEVDPLCTWLHLVLSIESYYKDVLQMLVVTELPDIKKLVREPNKESSIHDIEKILVLLLGCAVHCTDKEVFIENIKNMDFDSQTAIMSYIQKLTESCSYIIPLHLLDDDDFGFSSQFLNLINERAKNFSKYNQITRNPNERKESHKENELIKMKYQVMNLKEEIEDKDRQISELQTELLLNKTKLLEVQTKNFDLTKTSRLMQIYKDELDEYKEKAIMVEKYQYDLEKQKEKLVDLEFYKKQIEELRVDNERIIDIKLNMENIITAGERRQEKLINDLVQNQLLLDETTKENEAMQIRLSTMNDDSTSVEMEYRWMKEQLNYNKNRSRTSLNTLTPSGSLSSIHPVADEILETLNKQIYDLELERDNLKHELMSIKQELDAFKTQDNSNRTDESKLENLNRNANFEEILNMYGNLDHSFETASESIPSNNSSVNNINHNEEMDDLENNSTHLTAQDTVLKECLKIAERHSGCLTQKLDNVFTKMKELELSSVKDNEKIKLLQNQNENVQKEKEFLKKTLLNMQKTSCDHLNNLQAELEICKNQTSTLNVSSDRIKRLTNHDLVRYKQQYNHVPTQTIVSTKKHSLQKRCSLYNMHKINESTVIVEDDQLSNNSKTRSVSLSDENRVTPRLLEKNAHSIFSKPEFKNNSPFSRNSNIRASMPVKGSNSKVLLPKKSSSPISFEKFVPKNFLSREKLKNDDSKRNKMTEKNSDKQIEQQKTTLNNYETKCFKDSDLFDDALIDKDILSLLHCKVTKSCSDRWRLLVDKIIDIHDKNQALILENSELKKTINSIHFSAERSEQLDKDNIKLEVENRKLKKIIEVLQSSQSPYDRKIYHYYSQV